VVGVGVEPDADPDAEQEPGARGGLFADARAVGQGVGVGQERGPGLLGEPAFKGDPRRPPQRRV